MTRAVVFAYHDVGVRCLSVLLAHHVEVPLVVTHQDHPDENIWFASVAELARQHDIPVLAPSDPHAPEVIARIQSIRPDFLFSFYYRSMLKPALLRAASRGAFNMHGSLLPKYRGRVPVNWAIIHGERETGATLHEMVEKPDAGRIVDQQAVPILPDDIAVEVFRKVTLAAEIALDRCLPALLAGSAKLLATGPVARRLFRRPAARGWPHRLEQRRLVDPQSDTRGSAALPWSLCAGWCASAAHTAHAVHGPKTAGPGGVRLFAARRRTAPSLRGRRNIESAGCRGRRTTADARRILARCSAATLYC